MALLKSIASKLADNCRDVVAGHNEDGPDYSVAAPRSDMMRRHLENFPFRGKCVQPIISSDRQTVVAPPQLIARLFIDGFLKDINTRFPIFNEKDLREAVDIYYLDISRMQPLGESNADNPWAIIFNNIALLELGLESQVARWQGGLTGTSSIRTNITAGF
ncbi:uncharacterized protein F4822DRAFT_424803 [Hypoxylon trugodes]|uniref:uncharacterized protein n=1 Tax=Hypoxylon trugodes TaxID=326681 RepID=UPI002193B2C6|nr:uncharacterized protein F4822DRAFT_424803 [Hypoxylon trugodes]KAI1394325.1 hypothetical protein F4822DRAFT_424803 [Hypoxylon trugodes]